jgi:hypothetical protein
MMSKLSDISQTIKYLVQYRGWTELLDVLRAFTGRRLSYNQPMDREQLQEQTQLLWQALEEICAEALNRGAWPPTSSVV